MKITRLIALSLIAGIAVSAPTQSAEARPRPNGSMGGKDFQANKTFGLGLEFGTPSGLTAKYFLNESNALQFGLGWYNGYYNDYYGLHVYGDYLWHPLSLVSASAFELPLFVGVGLQFNSFEDRRDRVYDDGTGFGIRIPVGLAFDFNRVPLDIFFQVVPSFNFYSGFDNRSSSGFWIDGSIGIRYWFN
jgi:Protein of unknown function (DUF3996)/Outer membrane protein beta-barrel domain